MKPLREALGALLEPATAFADLGTAPPRSGRAFGRMLLWWLPPALLYGAFSAWNALGGYHTLRAGHLAPWLAHLILPGLDPDSSVAFLRSLPPPPAPGTVALAVLLLVPLSVVGIWLHDAVWDHTALWMLGALKAKRGFRATLLAESQALRIAALGSWIGLLGFIPGAGLAVTLPLVLLEAYLWVFRGFALAAVHGLPAWKGVLATVVHAALLGFFTLLLLGLMAWMLGVAG
ncbi:MAG: hypothetical protein KGI56_02880 [Acidobacteriota bacterium]|nr:hypothetical protein [Acidobacteriota bacterium]